MQEAFRAIRGHRPGTAARSPALTAAGEAAGRRHGGITDLGGGISHRVPDARGAAPAPRTKPLVLFDYPALVPTTARRTPGHSVVGEMGAVRGRGGDRQLLHRGDGSRDAPRALVRHEDERRRSCRTSHAVDPGSRISFPRAFPTCSGAALGVDRLEMVFNGEKSLEGVILFPFSAIVGGQSGTHA